MYTGFGLGYGPIVFMLQGNVVPSSVSVNPTKIQLVFKTGVSIDLSHPAVTNTKVKKKEQDGRSKIENIPRKKRTFLARATVGTSLYVWVRQLVSQSVS